MSMATADSNVLAGTGGQEMDLGNLLADETPLLHDEL